MPPPRRTPGIPHGPTARARYAALKRTRPDADPVVVAAESDAREARLAEYIKRLADAAPPLSDQQRARLAQLLSPRRRT